MSVRLLRGERAMTAINAIVALGAAGAVVGIVQYAALGYDHMENRPRGTLGHYMTYSGVLMLVTCTAAARLIYYRREWIWPAIAMPALVVAQVLTMSRNAWVGTVLAVSALLAFRQVKLLLLVPVALLSLFVTPAFVQERVFSIFDLQNATNQDRVAMIESGARMVRDRPLFGVGLNLVPVVYPRYRSERAVDPAGTIGVATRATLHNVPVQLAAERGLPALALWLWFVAAVAIGAVVLFHKAPREGSLRFLSAASLAAIVAMLAAGMFEHNFGDSEFLMPFLGIISLPFAARARGGSKEPQPQDVSPKEP
jgi:O-antigen ligase